MVGAACAPLGFGARPVDPAPVVDTMPARPAWVAPAAAASPRSDEDGIARLTRFAAVWHAVRWWHPDVAARGSAWDTAYLRHVEAARAARDDAAFAVSVEALLAELDDPASRVVRSDATGRDTVVAGAPERAAVQTASDGMRAAVVRTSDSLLVARPIQVQGGDVSSLRPLVPSTAAVLDLRVDSGDVAGVRWRARALTFDELPAVGASVAPLVARTLRRGAPDPMPGSARRDDDVAWLVQPFAPLPVGIDTASLAERPVVAIVNDASVISPSLLALHAAGRLVFVSTGGGALAQQPRTLVLPLGGEAVAHVRLAVWEHPTGTRAARLADTTVAGGSARVLVPDTLDAAVRVALVIARGAVRPGAAHASTAREIARRGAPSSFDAPSASLAAPAVPYPSLPERLLAVTQLWGAARAFSPYVPMADEDWDVAFAEALGAAEAATSARAWGTAVLRFAAALDASQVTVQVPDHPEFERRVGRVPFTLRLVDRRPLVASIDDTAAARSGVQVGDEIVAIGGEPIEKRLERLRPLIAASNAWSRDVRLRAWLEQGPAGVKATFRVTRDGRDGASRDLDFMYSVRDTTAARAANRQIDTLAGGVVRLRLGASTSPLPASLADAPAIIVDARGTMDAASLSWLAGSVLDADGRDYARDDRSWLDAPPTAGLRAPDLDPGRRTTRTVRSTPRARVTPFTGPMAVLVDATTAGDGELLVMRLLAGGGRRVLVGAPTAGAVGEVITLALAGGVRVTLPVGDVRHPDGRFVQRLGLSPTVSVAPTVAGVRSGRDEVLEAAQRWITQQLAPPPSRRR